MAQLRMFDDQERDGRYVTHWARAVIHSALGDREAVFRELDLAFEERAWPMFLLRVEPAMDPVRDDARFARLLERLRL